MSVLPANVERFGPEHRALADAKLRQAIEYHAEAWQIDRDGDMLSQFALVAHWEPQSGDDQSRYTTAFHVNPLPQHTARGLFATGLHIVDHLDDE